jgi:hypothetical protein
MLNVASRLANGQNQEKLTTTSEIDLLLETYLSILDEYQTARRKLSNGLITVS